MLKVCVGRPTEFILRIQRYYEEVPTLYLPRACRMFGLSRYVLHPLSQNSITSELGMMRVNSANDNTLY